MVDEADLGDRAGKLGHELMGRRDELSAPVAVVRVEQLYPFAAKQIKEILDRYPEAQDVRWVQEEPANMGAWTFVRPRLTPLLREDQSLTYVGPEDAASPSPGNYKVHAREEAEMVDRALERVDRPRRAQRPKVEAAGGRS